MSNCNELTKDHFAATTQATDRQVERAYRKPRVVAGGRSVDLLQSYSYGAYEDSYTRYKWNR